MSGPCPHLRREIRRYLGPHGEDWCGVQCLDCLDAIGDTTPSSQLRERQLRAVPRWAGQEGGGAPPGPEEIPF